LPVTSVSVSTRKPPCAKAKNGCAWQHRQERCSSTTQITLPFVQAEEALRQKDRELSEAQRLQARHFFRKDSGRNPGRGVAADPTIVKGYRCSHQSCFPKPSESGGSVQAKRTDVAVCDRLGALSALPERRKFCGGLKSTLLHDSPTPGETKHSACETVLSVSGNPAKSHMTISRLLGTWPKVFEANLRGACPVSVKANRN